MKTIKLSVIAVAALVLSACGSTSNYTYTSRSNAIDNVNITATKTIVDVTPDFSKRITAESSRCMSVDAAKEEAKYNAIINNKIDIVVDPIYKLEYKDGSVIAYLTGYAGYYRNPRTELGDIQLLESVSKETIEKYLLMKGDPQVVKAIYHKNGPCGENGVIINHSNGLPLPPPASASAPAAAPKSGRR